MATVLDARLVPRLSDAVSIRRQFPIFTRRKLHYLDSAATAQVPKSVGAAVESFDLRLRANVYGGVYGLAREALGAYEQSRQDVARFLGASSASEVVFTYGTTSSLNLLASSFGERLGPDDEIIISVLEHHSNTLPWRALARRRGVQLRVLPVTPEGRLDMAELPKLITKRCRLIALTHCSNVTGAITDVSAVVKAARTVGALVALDGAQAAPHGPLDVRKLGVDFYAFSGHKTFGPTGIGVLWGREALLAEMPPFMVGGQMIRRVTADDVEFARPATALRGGHASDRRCDRSRRCDPLDGDARLADDCRTGAAADQARAICARTHARRADRRTAHHRGAARRDLIRRPWCKFRARVPDYGPARSCASSRPSLRAAAHARARSRRNGTCQPGTLCD